jgi:hypothetical protein
VDRLIKFVALRVSPPSTDELLKLTQTLEAFRQDPTRQLFFLMEKCPSLFLCREPPLITLIAFLSGSKMEPGKPYRWRSDVDFSDLFGITANEPVVPSPNMPGSRGENAGKTSHQLAAVVQDHLDNMDAIVAYIQPYLTSPPSASPIMLSAAAPSIVSHVVAQPASAPLPRSVTRMDYAMSEGKSVSVLLRMSHTRVLQSQSRSSLIIPALGPAPALSEELPQVEAVLKFGPKTASHSDTAGASITFDDPGIPSPNVPVSATPVSNATATAAATDLNNNPPFTSNGRCPNYDEFCGKFPELEACISTAVCDLQRLQPAASQADADFATYSPDAVAFVDHYGSMLQGLDPILKAMQDLIALPLSYKSALTQDLVEYIPQSFTEPIFSGIDQISAVVSKLQSQINNASSEATRVATAYRAFHDHVVRVCATDRFSKFGQGVINLESWIRALQARLDTSLRTFTLLRKMGKNGIEDDEARTGTSTAESLASIDAVFKTLLPILEGTVSDMKQLPGQVQVVYDALLAVHADVYRFFQATKVVSEQCGQVEHKVVAADIIRARCERVHQVIIPFQSVLEQWGVHKDDPDVTQLKDNLKDTEKNLDVTVSAFLQKILPEIAFAGVEVVINQYLDLTDVTSKIGSLADGLSPTSNSLEAHLAAYDSALTTLVGIVEPKGELKGPDPSDTTRSILDDAARQQVQDACDKIIALLGTVTPPSL